MQTHQIQLEELQNFQANEKVLFASSSKENKQLYVTLRGSYEVWSNGKKIRETYQPFTATEIYNNL